MNIHKYIKLNVRICQSNVQNVNRSGDRITLFAPINQYILREIDGEAPRNRRRREKVQTTDAGRCGRTQRRKGYRRENASNLISIITKQSRGYWYRGRNIFPSNDHTGEGGGVQIASLLLSLAAFLFLFNGVSRQLRYF